MPKPEDWGRFAAQGFLGVWCNQVLFLYGVQLTDANVAAIINLTLPLFAAMLSVGAVQA